MAARIFISYRTADGMDKAVALARDLGRSFGDEQVFLDKDDLRGGSAWGTEVDKTIAERPVLLLLLTPQLIEAVGADGKLRINDPADPVRRELAAALEAGASVIPLLCDGLAAPPDASRLPEPFNRIGELTWRKLRAYDWAHDVERIVADLRAFGVEPVPAVNAAEPAPAAVGRKSKAPLLALAAGAALIAGMASWWLRSAPTPTPTPAPAPTLPAPVASSPAAPEPGMPASAAAAVPVLASKPPAAASSPSGITGRWAGRLSHGEQATLAVMQQGDRITFASEPVPIATRADWAEYRAFWRERTGRELNAVIYRGEGRLIADPGVARRIDIALKLYPSPGGGEPIDSGNLSATLSADGRTLTGTVWRNSLQADEPAVLKRKP